MESYFYLLLFIYFTYFILKISLRNVNKLNSCFLLLSFVAIYFFCTLRDYSVGRDIPGYMDTYNISGFYPLMDNSWTHMEVGYVTFMQLCSLAGFSTRTFFFIVYFLILFPIYYTFRKYSLNPLLSIIIFVCFQFLTFDLSGIRQGLAASICMMGLSFVGMKGIKNSVAFALLLALAVSVHRSSIIFALTPLVMRLHINKCTICVFLFMFAVAPSLTGFVMSVNAEEGLSKYTYDDRLAMGGMIVFLFLILIFVFYTCIAKEYGRRLSIDDTFSIKQYFFLLATGMFFTLAFNGTMLSRSTMCYCLIIAFAIPNAIKRHNRSLQMVLNVSFHLIFVSFFYLFCLLPKVLDTVPYKIGTDLPF